MTGRQGKQLSVTGVRALGSARCFSRVATAAAWPCCAAWCRGV